MHCKFATVAYYHNALSVCLSFAIRVYCDKKAETRLSLKTEATRSLLLNVTTIQYYRSAARLIVRVWKTNLPVMCTADADSGLSYNQTSDLSPVHGR